MRKKRSFPAGFLTVLAAILLFALLIEICFAAGIRRQISPEGTYDMSRRIDFYGAVAESLERNGITPEEWFTVQSDPDLLPRIKYTEAGLRGIADLPKFRDALRSKADDYADDIKNGSGRGKLRTEEFLALADGLYDDFVEYLDFRMLEKDRKDLENDLNGRNLPQYDFERLRGRFPEAVRAGQFLLSDTGFRTSVAAAAVLAAILLLLNRKWASHLFRSWGVPLLASGLLLLAVRGAVQAVTVLFLNRWMGLGTILLQALHLFFSYLFCGGLIAAGAGLIFCVIAGIASAKAK